MGAGEGEEGKGGVGVGGRGEEGGVEGARRAEVARREVRVKEPRHHGNERGLSYS